MVLFGCCILFQKWKRPLLLLAPSLVCLIVVNAALNGETGNLVQKDDYQEITDDAWGEEIAGLLQKETGLYRTEQSGVPKKRKDNVNRVWDTASVDHIGFIHRRIPSGNFQDFREKTFQVEQPFRNSLMQTASANPLFQKFMGVKYVIGRNEDGENFTSDMQEHVAPVIYGTSRLLSEKTYQTMEFPYNQTMLMQYAVTGSGHSSDAGVEKTKGIQKENVSFTAKKGITGRVIPGKFRRKKNRKQRFWQRVQTNRPKQTGSSICSSMWKMRIRTRM